MAKVLVVDDSAVDRRFVGGLLQRESITWSSSPDGADARPKSVRPPPTSSSPTCKCPTAMGWSVSAVRLHRTGIPIILMTGHGSEDWPWKPCNVGRRLCPQAAIGSVCSTR